MSDLFQVNLAHWPDDATSLRQVRERVFVVEQHVPVELEWDGIDSECAHVLATDQYGQAIGTGRLLEDGHIGRMAVLKEWRGRGVGSQIIELLMSEARRRHYPKLLLNAQINALPFYERFGFVSRGNVFDEAGIPHLQMILALTDI